MTVEEEDGSFTEERYNVDGSIETTRWGTDGSSTTEITNVDGTKEITVRDWEGNESTEFVETDADGNEVQRYEWEDEEGRTYLEEWSADGSA